MSKEQLDSDRVNYLIWRYLVESGYRDAAVHLQKEWDIKDPQQLPVAPHVTTHALVNLLNRGLLYNVIERESEKPAQEAGVPVTGFFGPLIPESPAAEGEFENNRKRQIDSPPTQESNLPPVKKPRLVPNGYDNRNDFESTAMEIDEEPQNGDENAYPSPEQVPSPAVATVGPEQGTQVDKVNELSTETTFLDLSDDPARNSNTVLLQCEFNPQDATILAAAGTDALARMWTLVGTAPESGSDGINKPSFAPHVNLLEDNAHPSTTSTGLSWTSDGSTIAVSSEPIDDGVAKVEFWTKDGSQFASYNTFESPVICLRWNPTNTSCLALCPERGGKGTLITVMHPVSDTEVRCSLPNHSLLDQPLDVAWTGNDEFVICGGDILEAFQYTESSINPTRKYDTQAGTSLSKITYDWRTQLLATASDNGTIDIWDHSGQRRSFNAHQGLITALAWQPMDSSSVLGEDSERLLASAGEDGAISIWNARSADTKSKSSMTMLSAVVALAFTPDGAFLAGGTNEKLLIWKVDDITIPRATWLRGEETGWQTPQSHYSTTYEDQFSLCWDANGQKLAYGVNNRLAIINFRP